MFTPQKEQLTKEIVYPGLSHWVDAFYRSKASEGLSRRTLEFYRYLLGQFTDYLLAHGIIEVEKIIPDDIRGYFLFLQETHTPGGLHGYFRVIKIFLRWFEAEAEPPGWSNPIRKVSPPRVPENILPPAPADSIRAILKTCLSNFEGLRDAAIILTLLDTGLRASELLNLNLADYDPYAGSLRVAHGKGDKARTVFAGKRTRKALRAWLRIRGSHSGPLFQTRDGARISYGGLRGIIRRRAIRTGVPVPSVHSFRRACAIGMLRSGADLISIQRLLGHSSLGVLQRYLAQTPGDLQAVHSANSPADRL